MCRKVEQNFYVEKRYSTIVPRAKSDHATQLLLILPYPPSLAFDFAFGLMRGSSSGPVNNRGIGMPIGSVELPRQYAHSFRLELQTALIEPIRFRGVDKDNADPAMLTLHLPSVAAAGLDDKHPDLLRFLEDHQGMYHAGVRRRCPTLDLAQPAMHPAREEAVKDDEGTFRFVELFAGIGGFRLGLENPEVGGQCVLSNELNPRAAAIYRDNFADSPSCLAEGDILDIASENIPDFDCLVGGFPCQPFTNRGDQKGLDDDRGQLYRELDVVYCRTSNRSASSLRTLPVW